MASIYNPIQSVNGGEVPCPSTYECIESDVSAADAGRTEDGLMHKMMIGRKVHLQLAWNNISTHDASVILNAFTAQEYFSVEYLDPKQGVFVTKTFYVGDRSVPSYSTRLGIWQNVTFNIIER